MSVTNKQVNAFLKTVGPIVAPLRATRTAAMGVRAAPPNRPGTARLTDNPDITRLHEILAENGHRIAPAVRQVIREIGERGTGRHDAIVSLAGFLTAHRWPTGDIIALLVPIVNQDFSDGDWRVEIEHATDHAKRRDLTEISTNTVTLGF